MKAGIKSPKRVCMLINEIFKVIKIFFFKASVYSSCSINVNGNTKKDRSTAKQRGSKTNTDPNPDSKLLPTAKKKRKSSNVEGASAEHVKKTKNLKRHHTKQRQQKDSKMILEILEKCHNVDLTKEKSITAALGEGFINAVLEYDIDTCNFLLNCKPDIINYQRENSRTAL